MSDAWSGCDYYCGVGHCTERWRNCAFYGEPKCITDEPYPLRDARGRFVASKRYGKKAS